QSFKTLSKNMKLFASFAFIVLSQSFAFGQNWTRISSRDLSDRSAPLIQANNFILVRLDDQTMVSKLTQSAHERSSEGKGVSINIMLADGSLDEFKVLEYQMMEEALALKFPEIKTYIGSSASDPYRTVRIDVTTQGFRAVISDRSGQTYIDPYHSG